MSECARPGCINIGINRCSICQREPYCGGNCQKLDWKAHKLICKTLKNFSNELQSYDKAYQVIHETIASGKVDDARILEHLLSYAEHQFGNEMTGMGYRVRDGIQVHNWDVEINIFLKMNSNLIKLYDKDMTDHSTMIRDSKRLFCIERSLSILSPWLVHLDSDTNDLNTDQIKHLLRMVSDLEYKMALITMKRIKFVGAEGHCKRCLQYSKREGVEEELFALSAYIRLRQLERDYSGAVKVSEEAYNLAAITYDLVHPSVTTAASTLIDSMIKKGDLFNAERFAAVTHGSFKDHKNGIDQESEDVALASYNFAMVILESSYNFAKVILEEGSDDLLKAEELARESLRIRTKLFGSNHQRGYKLAESSMLLGSVLQKQDKNGNEIKELLKRSLSIWIRHEGPDGINVATANITIGRYFLEDAQKQPFEAIKEHLLIAKSYFDEGLRIETKIYGPDSYNARMAVDCINPILRMLKTIPY